MSSGEWIDGGWARDQGPGTFIPLQWTPGAPEVAPRRRARRVAMAGLLIALAAGAGVLGYVAWHEHHVAAEWRRLDMAQTSRAAQLDTQVRAADERITAVNGEIGALQAQISGLQGQLASVANQKEKAVDHETLLQQLLSAAGNVANNLQQCITATTQLESDINAAIGGSGSGSLDALQAEANTVSRACNKAESANQQLQSAIQNAP